MIEKEGFGSKPILNKICLKIKNQFLPFKGETEQNFNHQRCSYELQCGLLWIGVFFFQPLRQIREMQITCIKGSHLYSRLCCSVACHTASSIQNYLISSCSPSHHCEKSLKMLPIKVVQTYSQSINLPLTVSKANTISGL